jgi:hypothetical protein
MERIEEKSSIKQSTSLRDFRISSSREILYLLLY